MKVLAINSSARKDGNTAILVNTVFAELNKEGIKTEMVQLSGKMMSRVRRAGLAAVKRTVSIRMICFRKSLKRQRRQMELFLRHPSILLIFPLICRHFLLSPLDYPPARTGRAVNDGRRPIILPLTGAADFAIYSLLSI